MARRSEQTRREATGIAEIDRLSDLNPCTIQDYIAGVSAYIRQSATLADGPKKASQIRLSKALARSLAYELEERLPHLSGKLITDERTVAGGLRSVKADVSESDQLDGLRLAIELKPVNLAVGRAIWNRFGDIRTFAVNIHLKFPFAVVGGVLIVPTYEVKGTEAARKAEQEEAAKEDSDIPSEDELNDGRVTQQPRRLSTMGLIERAIARLIRAGGRKSEADAPHLLEGIAVVVFDPDTGRIDGAIPSRGSGLRWNEFIDATVSAYQARFEY